MKRCLSAFIALLILLGCGSAVADDAYEEPILFRGIEWGASYTDTLKGLPAGVTMYALRNSEYWYTMDDYMFTSSNMAYHAEIGAYAYARASSLNGVKVAGYDVSKIDLYFAYLPGDDGLLVKDKEHTSLFYAYYCLEPKDPNAVFEDLKTKLTSLYGDVDYEQTKSSIISYEQALWNGADGTMVSLIREDYSSGSHYIYIKYGFKGGNDLLKAAYEAAVLEETLNAVSNTDGL